MCSHQLQRKVWYFTQPFMYLCLQTFLPFYFFYMWYLGWFWIGSKCIGIVIKPFIHLSCYKELGLDIKFVHNPVLESVVWSGIRDWIKFTYDIFGWWLCFFAFVLSMELYLMVTSLFSFSFLFFSWGVIRVWMPSTKLAFWCNTG